MRKVTLVSVDSPDYKNRIFPGKNVYMRMHGREGWYSYDYSQAEISETIREIYEFEPEKTYIYFNNDHNMLDNARKALRVFFQVCKPGIITFILKKLPFPERTDINQWR